MKSLTNVMRMILGLINAVPGLWMAPHAMSLRPSHNPVALVAPPPAAPLTVSRAPRHLNADTMNRYNYLFEGKATHEGRPLAQAGIAVSLRSPAGSETKWVLTDPEGNYSVPFTVFAYADQPIRWSIEGRYEGLRHVSLSGQRLAMSETSLVTVNGPIELAQRTETPSPDPLQRDDQDLGPQ